MFRGNLPPFPSSLTPSVPFWWPNNGSIDLGNHFMASMANSAFLLEKTEIKTSKNVSFQIIVVNGAGRSTVVLRLISLCKV